MHVIPMFYTLISLNSTVIACTEPISHDFNEICHFGIYIFYHEHLDCKAEKADSHEYILGISFVLHNQFTQNIWPFFTQMQIVLCLAKFITMLANVHPDIGDDVRVI